MDSKNKVEEYKKLLGEKNFQKIIENFKQDYMELFKGLLEKEKIEYDEWNNTFEILSTLVAENHSELEKSINYIKGILVREGIDSISIVEDLLDTYLYIKKKCEN